MADRYPTPWRKLPAGRAEPLCTGLWALLRVTEATGQALWEREERDVETGKVVTVLRWHSASDGEI